MVVVVLCCVVEVGWSSVGAIFCLFMVTRPDPSESGIYFCIWANHIQANGSAVKRVMLAHVHGFNSRLCIFFLGQSHAIQLKNNVIFQCSDRNPMGTLWTEIPRNVRQSYESPIGLSRTELGLNLLGTCHFMSIWLVKYFNWNMVRFLGVQSENSDSDRSPIGIGGGV